MSLCQATGNTDQVCQHLTTLFQSDTEVRVQQLQGVLEPLLIGMVSLTTGTLLLSIYWPLGKFLQTLLG
jgi:type II secretory pathway component PulF